MRASALLAFALSSAAAWSAEAPDATSSPPPVETGLAENVVVRLVTIDAIALDRSDRTVPGLGKEAFRLFVDGKDTPIDTLDASCGQAPEPDPRPNRLGAWTTPPDLDRGTRRIVLAFDYLHLPTVWCPDLDPPGPCMLHTQALQAFEKTIEDKQDIHDEQIMIVALTGGLRVEQPFTTDRRAVVEALRRMEYDVTLWNGRFDHITEDGLFRSLEALATLLRAAPGPKSVVLLTAGEGPSNRYDQSFARLATLASDAQARFYPVDCRGLTTSAPYS